MHIKKYNSEEDAFTEEVVAFCKDAFDANLADDMESIRKLGRSDMTVSSVYRFPVYLCDNEIDRESEILTRSALESIAQMMLGKPGIFAHDYDSVSNHSRIYKTYIYESSTLRNILGEPLTCVIGFAFTPATEENKEFINNVDLGVFKEVSIGFNGVTRCSICGDVINNDTCSCSNGHTLGSSYDLDDQHIACLGITGDITDCLEWSFVPVPCIKHAGVIHTKTYKERNDTMADKVETNETVEKLKAKIKELEDKLEAKDGEMLAYKKGCGIRKAIDGLKPKSDVAAQIAYDVIMGNDGITFDDEGVATKGLDDAIESLKDTHYFLFDEIKDNTEDEDGAVKTDIEDDDDAKEEDTLDEEDIEKINIEQKEETEDADTKTKGIKGSSARGFTFTSGKTKGTKSGKVHGFILK